MIAQEQILPVTMAKEISYTGESIDLYRRCGYIENGNYVEGIGAPTHRSIIQIGYQE